MQIPFLPSYSLLFIRIDALDMAPEHGGQSKVMLNFRQKCHVHFAGVAAKRRVHLLQGLAPSLRDEEEDKEEAKEQPEGKEDVCAPRDISQHWWCDEGDDEVAARRNSAIAQEAMACERGDLLHPVRTGPDRGAFGADREREDLSDEDPAGRSLILRCERAVPLLPYRSRLTQEYPKLPI